MSNWYWNKAANILAYSMARDGSTVQEIIDAILKTKWLKGKAAIACAITNWEAAQAVDPHNKIK